MKKSRVFVFFFVNLSVCLFAKHMGFYEVGNGNNVLPKFFPQTSINKWSEVSET